MQAEELGREMGRINSLIFTPQNQVRLRDLTHQIVLKRPDLENYDAEQLAVELAPDLPAGLHQRMDCASACAAALVFEIIAIEAGFVLGVIGCEGTIVGFPICVGLVFTVKNALTARATIGAIQCSESCRNA